MIFVPNTKAGDRVKVRIKSISRRFAEAKVAVKEEFVWEEESE